MRKSFGALLVALAIVMTACTHADAPRRVAVRRVTTTTAAPTTTTTTTPPPAPPRTFADASSDDASRAAADIAAAEAATLAPATGPEELHNAAIALQLAYRKISLRDISVEQAVSAALPEQYRMALAYNVAAGRHLIALGGNSAPKPAPPAGWRIVSPAPEDQLVAIYKEASANTGVPWTILAAVNFVETRLGRVQGVSSAGALGPMQFLPSTWAAYGQGDIHSVRDSIATAARYLKANGAPERLDDAIFRYNHSSHYVEAIKAYANRLAMNETAFRGYYEWQVFFRTQAGMLMLPVGWPDAPAINVGMAYL